MIAIPSPRGKRRARIEIIPLIDIVFFLLATFVMVSLSMVRNHGISVNLPKASTGVPQECEPVTTLSIRADGLLLVGKELVAMEDLDAALERLAASSAEPRVLIEGDASAGFGVAISVLDAVRKRGISKVAIQTQPQGRAPAAP
jgi:biopolymer transport protein ExbD